MSYPPSSYTITWSQSGNIQASAMLECSWQSQPSPTNPNPEIAYTLYFGPGDCTQAGWTSSAGVISSASDISYTDMTTGDLQGPPVSLNVQSSGGSNIVLSGVVNWANSQDFVGSNASLDNTAIIVLSGNLVWPGTTTVLGANTGFNALLFSDPIPG